MNVFLSSTLSQKHLMLLSVSFQLLSTILLAYAEASNVTAHDQSLSYWKYWWCSPANILFTCHSLAISFKHLLIYLTIIYAQKQGLSLFILSLSSLLYCFPGTIVAVPSFLNLYRQSRNSNDVHPAKSYKPIGVVLAILFLLVAVYPSDGPFLALWKGFYGFVQQLFSGEWSDVEMMDYLNSEDNRATRARSTFAPSAGILWYLDAQMLPGFEDYFEVLIPSQIAVTAAVLFFLAAQKVPLITVFERGSISLPGLLTMRMECLRRRM
jgi:hypothetical protein